MRRATALAVLGVLALACAQLGGPRAGRGAPALPAPAAEPQRLVLVTIHGLDAASYLAAEPAMPALAALAQDGVAAEALVPVFPATVYAAHATLATGVEPARHGIGADHRLSERGVSPAFLDQAGDLRAPTLFAAVQHAGGRTAALDWPTTVGAPIDELAPDLVLSEGESWAGALARFGAGRVAELAVGAGGGDSAANRPGAARDTALVTIACGLLTGNPAPRLLALRLSRTADALARHAAGSAAVRVAFTQADADVARLLDCLGHAGLLASTAIAVAGDFGVAPVHTELRPNAALAEIGLLAPATGGVRGWEAIARANGGSAFVYAADEEAALLARQALERFANETGASRVVSAKEMVARGADSQAWFGLVAEPGFVFGDAAEGGTIAAAPVASASLGAEREPRAAAGFVAWGPLLRAGVRIPTMRQTDVAPTLAHWMGVPLEGAQGRVLVGLFGTGGR